MVVKMSFPIIPYNSFLYIPITVIVILSWKKYYQLTLHRVFSKSEQILSTLFGFLFVLLYSTGLVLAADKLLNFKGLLFILTSCLLFTFAGGISYHYLNTYFDKQFNCKTNEEYLISKHPIASSFCIILVCWIPVFLAMYPGIFSYDFRAQLAQNTHGYNTHHPLLHTIYLVGFYKFGNLIDCCNKTMALSVFIQMAVFAFSLSYSIQYLVIKKVKKTIVITVLLCFALIPIFPIMAVSVTKDIFFTAAFNATFIKLLKLKDNDFRISSLRDYISIIFLFVLTALLRNNGKYAVFAVLFAIVLKAYICRSDIIKKSILAVLTIVLILFAEKGLISITHAQKGTKDEILSVPYQQIARVYKYNNNALSDNDRKMIEKLLPDVSEYNEFISDEVKRSTAVFSVRENTKSFWSIYFKYLFKIPNRYMEAFLKNTMGYWYLDDISSSKIYEDKAEMYWGLFQLDIQPGLGITQNSKLPFLNKIIRMLFHDNEYQNIPIIAVVFNMGLYFWLIILTTFYSIQMKKKDVIIPEVFLFSFILTIFAGPCALFRYALPYIVCMPSFIAAVYTNVEHNIIVGSDIC